MEKGGWIVRTTDASGRQRIWYVGENDPSVAEQMAMAQAPGTVKTEVYREITVEQAQEICLLGGEIRELT
jgi:copper(I)-binding protein